MSFVAGRVEKDSARAAAEWDEVRAALDECPLLMLHPDGKNGWGVGLETRDGKAEEGYSLVGEIYGLGLAIAPGHGERRTARSCTH